MRKFLLFAVTAMLLGSTASAQEEPQVVEEIIVKVNGDIITRSQFREIFDSFERQLSLRLGGEELQRELEKGRKRIFNSMINEMVIRQRAEERDIRMPDEFFREQVEAIKRQIGANSDEEFRRVLAGQGLTMEDFRRQYEQSYNLRVLFGSEVGRDLYQSESRLQSYYEENIERYTEPARLRLSQIVFPFTIESEERQEEAARASLERLQAGEDFVVVYRSVTPQAAPDADGDIGLVDLQSFRTDLADEVKDLEQGQITGIIRSESAFLILKVTERVPEKVIPLEEIKDSVINDMQTDTMLREMSKYVTRLKQQSLIRVMALEFEGLYEETFFESGR